MINDNVLIMRTYHNYVAFNPGQKKHTHSSKKRFVNLLWTF